jgi:hypothetical protein
MANKVGMRTQLETTTSLKRMIPPDVLGLNPTYQDIGFPGENISSYQFGRNPRQKVKAAELDQEYLNSLN